jgi:hypothetical protein
MPFAVVYKDQRTVHDYYDPEHPSRETVDVYKEFPDQKGLLAWIESNDRYGKKTFRAFELKELSVERNFSLHPL